MTRTAGAEMVFSPSRVEPKRGRVQEEEAEARRVQRRAELEELIRADAASIEQRLMNLAAKTSRVS